MTPTNTAPRAPFLSLALERPGSDAVPSVLGIGRHPDELVPDPGKIRYSGLVTESAGTLFWQASVQAITVYVSGQPRPVQLGPSVTGAMYPSAVLDSGTPVILTTPPIANGIYGALGISPSSDGQYYVPCTTPINMTITLDDRPEIPLHPLDLSFPPPSTSSTSMCIGMIQNAGSTGSSEAQIADMILGVPFLRNTYTVMAYEPPDDSGNFPANDSMAAANYLVRPRLGLLNLTNITAALQEFNTVRVQHEPLGQSSPSSGGSSPSSSSGKHLPVGVDVLFGLIAFFGLCFTLFTARWMYMRRKWRRSPQGLEDGDRKAGSYGMSDIPYTMARRTSDTEIYGDSEDTLHSLHYDDHRHPKDVASQYTDDTALTRVEDTPLSEFGFIQKKRDVSPGRSTLDASWDPLMPNPSPSPSTSPHCAPSLVLARSDYSVASSHQRTPSGEPGVTVPLLAHTRQDSHLSRSEDVAEFGMGLGLRTEFEPDGQSLAGVGTAARGGRIDVHERQSSAGSVGSIISLQGARGSRARPRRTPSGPRRAERMSTGASNKSSSPVR
ncbi:hypothetical protein AcV7_005033 [Taiwanofungus camphoratus]|nr:hypothetical protein AcV7_005033 [Antrodia cinnamomea]